jgi:hypothetical protein
MAIGKKVHTRKKAGGLGSKRKMAKGGLIRKKTNSPVKNAASAVGKGVKKVVKKVGTTVTNIKKKKKPVVKGSGANPRFMGSSTQKRDYNNSLKKKA